MQKKLIIPAKKVKGEDGYKVFSIRVKEETVKRLDALSEETGRSRNELIGVLLSFALDNCEVSN